MKRKLSAIGLLLLFFCVLITAADLDDEEIFDRFINHVKKVYMTHAKPSLSDIDFQYPFGETRISARLLGYALGNLILYARRGTENYEILLMLEKKTKDTIFSKIDQARREVNFPVDVAEKRKQEVWQDFMRAQQGWYDEDMARLTNVQGKDAPDFFQTLAESPPEPTVQPTPPTVQTQTSPPTPPPTRTPPPPPTPPTATMGDEVEGTYEVIGQLWENDPSCGSSVVLKGSMIGVEAEFKLWDGTGVTWHYKGNAQWDAEDHGLRPYDLSGSVQNVKYPQLQDGLAVRITLGENNRWRATNISIGGNHFDLKQIQSTGTKKVTKILTIRNATEKEISVYLEMAPGRYTNKLGSIAANSQKSFTNIPERGRWYVSISYTARSTGDPYNINLYIKENQFVYLYEVKPEHLR